MTVDGAGEDDMLDICPCCEQETDYIIEEAACHKCMYRADMEYERQREGE